MLIAVEAIDFRRRPQHLRAMAQAQFDLLVIGGGITGAGIARGALNHQLARL